MRPSLLLPLLCVGWALLGVAASAAWLPALAWWATGGVLLSVALLDGWRLRRYALPEVLHRPGGLRDLVGNLLGGLPPPLQPRGDTMRAIP